MLSPGDASLVSRDRLLPGLALLFDEAALSEELLRLCPEAAIGDLHAHYVRYKPGVSCIVGYHTRTPDGGTVLYARAHAPSARSKIEKATTRRHVQGPAGFGAVTIDSSAAVVYAFPNDHELRALPHLEHLLRRRALLARLMYDSVPPGDIGYEPMRYKPERRYVARVSCASEPKFILKFYVGEDFSLAKTNARVFEPDGPLHLAALAGHSDRRRVLAFRWLEGTPLRQAIEAAPRPIELIELTGAALARLHRRSPTGRMRRASKRHVNESAGAAAAIAAIRPDLAGRAEALARRLDQKLSEDPLSPTAIHGDLSSDQVLICGDRIVLLDLDRARAGDPRLDIGNFAANLLLEAIGGRLPTAAVQDVTDCLLDGYRREAGVDLRPNISRFVAANLMRMAVEPFRRRQENWFDMTEAVLAEAEELVNRGQCTA
jgi:Ser/Thr protein kinase RdoA (MazF antagonist)